jgi:PHP family Zn ribbon phosphoesterase
LSNQAAAKTTETGYVNRHLQKVIRRTNFKGNGHLQYVYQLACSKCGENYGANGADIFERRCPACDGGAPGLKYK